MLGLLCTAMMLSAFVSVDARPHFDTTDVHPALRAKNHSQVDGKYSHSFEGPDGRGNTLKFAYTARKHNHCLVADDDESIVQIECGPKHLRVRVASGELPWKVGAVVVGGDEWGCAPDNTEEAMSGPVFRKIEAIERVDAEWFRVDTDHASLQHCFEHLDVRP